VVSELRRLSLSDGVEIAYRDEGAGEPLLLLHGVAEDHRAWDEIAPALARDCRVVRIDLPGHGASSPLPEFSAGAFTTAVARFLAAIELGQPRVVGHSFGAMVATLLGAYVPLRSVINVDQPLRLGPFIAHVHAFASRLAGASFAPALAEELESRAGPRLPAHVRAQLRAYCVPERRAAVLGIWLPLLDQTEARLLEAMAPMFARLRAPYLALHGSEPGVDYAQWLGARIAGARVETWEECGHWLHRVEPERFLARVREFHASA
jgi:pimeloyl-ACP methyl ester carboxylesterase